MDAAMWTDVPALLINQRTAAGRIICFVRIMSAAAPLQQHSDGVLSWLLLVADALEGCMGHNVFAQQCTCIATSYLQCNL